MFIKSFKLFESNDQEIHDICNQYDIEDYSINADGSIDVESNVELYNKKISKIPLKFGKVSLDFYCNNNQLTSLDGVPSHVGRYFNCQYNQLTSLKGAPSYVGGDFYCHANQLASLEGVPSHVGGGFYCENNQLTSLEGAPNHVGGDFNCQYNKLTSLEGAPSHVGGSFYCVGNPIYEIYYLFKTPKCIESINEYDVIQGKNIVLSRLEEVYHELGMEIPVKFNFKYYKLIE